MRADMLLELRDGAGGFRPVAGIVDARRDLVDEQRAVAEHEELDADDADIVERFEDGEGVAAGQFGGCRRDGGRHGGRVQYAVAVDVLGRIVGGERAVAAARGDDGNLALEGDERLQDQRHAAHGGIGAVDVAAEIPEHALALAVITHAAGLQHAAAAEVGQRRGKIGVVVHRKEIRCGYADAVEEALFRKAVLADLQRLRGREHRNALGKPRCRGDRHVLEFIGDDVAKALPVRPAPDGSS